MVLATVLSGCAVTGNDHPPTLAQLDLPDRYSNPPGTVEGTAVDTSRWWTLLADPFLADLAGRLADPAAQADMADAYIDLRLAQARIDHARAHLSALGDMRDVARFRAEAKLVTERDALQIDAERARVAAVIPPLEASVAANAAHVAVLAGEAPGAFRERLAQPAEIPVGPATVAVGEPSALLDKREDLRAAAARLRAANWLGHPSPASLAAYRKAVLAAQEEVENALAAFDGAKAREQGLVDALAKAESVASLAQQQYRDGLAGYDAFSGAEAALRSVRDDLAEARAARALALIALCEALGSDAAVEAGGH